MSDPEDKQISLPLQTDAPPKATEEQAPIERPTLEWVSHPAKRNKLVTAAVSLFLVILIVMVYYMTYSALFTVLAFTILYGSLSPFYFPTRYILTDNEILVKTTLQRIRKNWSQYRTFYPDKNGVLLSPFVRPSRLENFRGLYLRFWYNRDEVLAYVKEHIEKAKAERTGDA